MENNRINKNIGQSGTRRGTKANTPARMSDIEEIRREISSSMGGEKIYEALLNQSGISAPTITELVNDFGESPTPSYDGIGTYLLTFSGSPMTANKTALSNGTSGGGGINLMTLNSANEILIESILISDGSYMNNNLIETSIRIVVYP